MLAFYDTETSGFINPNLSPTDNEQGRLMQIAVLIVDKQLNVVNEFSAIIQPQQPYKLQKRAGDVHGITKAYAESYGIDFMSAVTVLSRLTGRCRYSVCHNHNFDSSVMENESKAFPFYELDPPLSFEKSYCTMRSGLGRVIGCTDKRGRSKLPNLQESYEFFTGKKFEGAHNAMADIKATLRVFKGICDEHPDILPNDLRTYLGV